MDIYLFDQDALWDVCVVLCLYKLNLFDAFVDGVPNQSVEKRIIFFPFISEIKREMGFWMVNIGIFQSRVAFM
jgi:hypothetical protein